MKTIRKNEIDMLHGSLSDKILLFALPLAASSILQQLFNSADVAVVGHFVGSQALAAVGANTPVIQLLINLFVGLSVGTNVLISNSLGRGDEAAASRGTHTSVVLSVLCGAALLLVGVLFAGPILRLMATPDDVLDAAMRYLRVYMLGMPFIMLYNFENAILRSKGDTRRPLYVLTASGVLNVLLNLFFVLVLHMDVVGVAAATALSNVFSAAVLFVLLRKESGAFQVRWRELRLDLSSLKAITTVGLPAGMQAFVFSVSNVVVQFALNGLGADAIAGTSAALNFEFFAFYILNAFNQTAVTFTSQNYGAGNYTRCRKIALRCWALGVACVMAVSILELVFARQCVAVFTADAAVAALAITRMHCVLPFEFMNSSTDILSGCVRGLGHSMAPAVVCTLGICGVRILYIYTYFAMNPGYIRLMLVYPFSWAITLIAAVIMYFRIRNRTLLRKEAAQ